MTPRDTETRSKPGVGSALVGVARSGKLMGGSTNGQTRVTIILQALNLPPLQPTSLT